MNGDTTLEVTELSYTEGENITYYAVWAHSSRAISVGVQTSGNGSELVEPVKADNMQDG